MQVFDATTLSDSSTANGFDIVAFDLSTSTTSLYFDGIAAGLREFVRAIHLAEDGSILMSLRYASIVPGIPGVVDRADIIRFVPAQLGAATRGSFELLLDGSDVGLTGSITGIGRAADGRLVVSTPEGFKSTVSAFTATSLGTETQGAWETLFSTQGVGLSDVTNEYIGDLWLDAPAGVA
ncbi:MAG: hypothetical protein KDE46_25985, partial [Caldilineaceae bacterium]|nr:hypothetical protein [Caldilineaceae bacterium]